MGLHANIHSLENSSLQVGKNVAGFLSGLGGWAQGFFMLYWDEFVKVN